FEIQKMNWFSKKYMQNKDDDELISKLNFEEIENYEWKKIFVETFKQSCSTINEMQTSLNMFKKDLQPIEKYENEVVTVFIEQLKIRDFNVDSIQEAINKTKEITKKNGK
ncbi:MAG: glutamate--tRNA ligase, partial [Mycoplasmataceae bacterium]|nr:glutamate--tRNA ligase [Mycoplasmataceae bacterium]